MSVVDLTTSDSAVFNFQLLSKLGNQFDYLGCPKQLMEFASAKLKLIAVAGIK